MDKRGVELAISTLIVIILGLLVLTMGTFFIGKTYCNAILGVESWGDITAQEIQRLYSEQEGNVVVKEQVNEMPKNSYYGVGFVITNEKKATISSFKYTVDVSDLQDCDITEDQAMKYIVTSTSNNIEIAGGSSYSDVIQFRIPKEAPTCSLKYEIKVESQGVLYGSTRFTVEIQQAPFFRATVC